MSFIPKVQLYSDLDVLVYTFPIVSEINIPQTSVKGTMIEGIRGIGGIFIQGSLQTFELSFTGTLFTTDYEALTTMIDSLESAVVAGTKYILKLEKSVSQKYSYNVIRIKAIDYPPSLRTQFQEYKITFQANSW